jgi:hypothetical protein
MLKILRIIVKKIDATSKTKPTICISSISEGQIQVRWVATIGWKT